MSRAKGWWSRAKRAVARRTGDLLVYVDADCRAPLTWLERVERRFARDAALIALSGPYRFYDWDWWGRALDPRLRLHARAGDTAAGEVRPADRHASSTAAISPCAATALEQIGGFDTSIEFHGEDTNLGRRLFAVGKVSLHHDCYLYTSARRYVAMGKGAVFRLYVRNFTSELLHHRPKDTTHLDVRMLMPGTNRSCSATFTSTRAGATAACRSREVVDLYGQTGKFDVIAITDHILMRKDLLARAGRLATLGRRSFGVARRSFGDYLADIQARPRARAQYGMLVIAGAESRRTSLQRQARTRTSSRSTSRNTSAPISRADDPARDPPAGRAEHRLPSAPSDDAAARDQHVLSVGSPQGARRTWSMSGRRPTATTCSP